MKEFAVSRGAYRVEIAYVKAKDSEDAERKAKTEKLNWEECELNDEMLYQTEWEV